MSVASISAVSSPVPIQQEHPQAREMPHHEQAHHQAAAADMQKISLAFNKKLQYVVDQKSNEVIVKVIDTQTDKVIKVLPPEELQRLHSQLRDTVGFLFDQEV